MKKNPYSYWEGLQNLIWGSVGIQSRMRTVYGVFPRAGGPGQCWSLLSSDPSQHLQPEGPKQNQNGWEQVPAESVATAAPTLHGLCQEN